MNHAAQCLVRGLLAGVLLPSPALAQNPTIAGDWVYRRELRDLPGQSSRDMSPRGRGYFTPLYLPGFDNFNGPSRAYSPIFNAPGSAPAFRQRERIEAPRLQSRYRPARNRGLFRNRRAY